MTKEEKYRLWLNFAVKADYNMQNKLLNMFGSASEIFNSVDMPEIAQLVGMERANKIKSSASEAYIDKCLNYLANKNIKAVTLVSDDYPKLLKNIDDPPFVLYYKGRLESEIKLPIAMIGSRVCSEYAKSVTTMISSALCDNGACIISGMALGIDGEAAKAALSTKSDYPTVAVLGCGVDVVYPDKHLKLYHEIIERGAVISEFLPGTGVEKWHFPFRNRIISGLSLGVVVTEAREKSGTSITVGKALEQGRDVFIVPGRITDSMCKGSNAMLRDGYAKLIFGAEEILSEYGIKINEHKEKQKHEVRELKLSEMLVCKLLQVSERSFDELAVMTGMDMSNLNSVLTDLEFSGIIKQLPGRIYEIMPEFDFLDNERQW
ncbi:MAG: DNA-processing protein DprA [Clostridia bacterium]|nr:DNA-processing protein DprA [Clostridia bacterium]